jgi:hypothetical protein
MEYKSFIEQLRECKKEGTQREIENIYGTKPPKFLVCTKYWQCCSSRVCFPDRYKVADKDNLNWFGDNIDVK